jgi:hypothetical protein
MQTHLRRIIVAALLSIPLLPLIVIPTKSADYFTAKDVLLIAPFMLEFWVFYSLYKFSQQQATYSKYEQKLLLLLSSGLFILLGVPIVITVLAQPVPGVATVGFVLMMLYSYGNLVFSTQKIAHSRKEIGAYFNRHFVWPAVGAVVLMAVTAISTSVIFNLSALYFIFKNFSHVIRVR